MEILQHRLFDPSFPLWSKAEKVGQSQVGMECRNSYLDKSVFLSLIIGSPMCTTGTFPAGQDKAGQDLEEDDLGGRMILSRKSPPFYDLRIQEQVHGVLLSISLVAIPTGTLKQPLGGAE